MKNSIETEVVQAIARKKGIDPAAIGKHSKLDELGVSSLDAITILYEIEEKFDVEIPNEELERLTDVQQIIDGIAALIDAKNSG